MFYKFNDRLINLTEVLYTAMDSTNDSNYPYGLYVHFKNGKCVGVQYTSIASRKQEFEAIQTAMARLTERMYPNPDTLRYQISSMITTNTEKVRRDLKALKTLVLDAIQDRGT